ncbi:hypothetical protein M5K25_000741 [Dendrobium thyrsiflorum]|uniref:Uncharacterized protein n=1 Tax=Dendrobium thyrsiflorum TaxID=117978 RepID=A0ABD0VUK3_DENTH
MASGDQRQKGLIKNTFRRSKKVTGGPSRPTHTEGVASSQPASQTQPSPPVPPPTTSSPQFHSPDPRFPSPDVMQSTPFYPYYPPPPSYGGPPPYPYPYPYPPYVPPPPQPSTGEPSTPAAAQQATEGRMLIEPDGDTFHPSKQPTHKIQDIIRSRYDAPYLSWKKVPKDVRDMWFREFEKEMLGREPTSVELHSHTHKRQEDKQWVDERARRAYEEYTRLRESQAAAGEGPSGGSAEISDYRTWSQAVGGVQHGRVYGLGSQAYTYEWQTSAGSSSFSPTTQEALYTQQIAALTAELEQMQMQQQQAEIQRQQAEMLEEMRKMR